jgi:hypothetical protein
MLDADDVLAILDRHDLRLLAERFGVAVPPGVQLEAGGGPPPASGGPGTKAGGATRR